MKNLNRYTIMLMFFPLIHIVGCASYTAPPPGWIPSASIAQHEAFGGWISVYRTGDSESEVHGELIAINSNQLFILTAQELTSIPANSISRMKLTTHNAGVLKEYLIELEYPGKSRDTWDTFRNYARFPQGLPEDLDVQSLKPREKRSFLRTLFP